jgi:hypothetical protein
VPSFFIFVRYAFSRKTVVVISPVNVMMN